MRCEMEMQGFKNRGQKTLLKIALHLEDKEVKVLGKLSKIRLLVLCPDNSSNLLFHLANSRAPEGLETDNVLLNIDADGDLFQSMMNPKLTVELVSANEKAEFKSTKMGHSYMFSTHGPLVDVIRTGPGAC